MEAASVPQRDRPSWKVMWIVYAAAAAVCLLFNIGLLQKGGFYKDDYEWVLIGRELARSPAFLFTPDERNPEFALRVTQRVLMALQYPLGRLQPLVYNIVGVLLHALAATGVFVLARALLRGARGNALAQRSAPFVAAGLFATSSGHVAAVQWIAAQSTVIATFLVVVVFAFFVYRLADIQRRSVGLWLVGGTLAILFTKSTALIFPLLPLCYMVCFGVPQDAAKRRRALQWTALLGLIAMVYFVVQWMVLGGRDLQDIVANDVSPHTFDLQLVLLNLCGAFLGTVVPAVWYEPNVGSWIPYPVASLLLLVALLSAAATVRRLRLGLFCLAWIVVAALPIAFFNYEQYSAQQVMVTRYYHLAVVGMAVWLAVLVTDVLGRLRRLSGVVAVLLLTSHLMFHERQWRAKQEHLHKYTTSIAKFIETVENATERVMSSGSEVYAQNWPISDRFVPTVGRLWFEQRDIELHTQAELETMLETGVPDDGVERWSVSVRRPPGEVWAQRLEAGMKLVRPDADQPTPSSLPPW